jgi:hypothetical protein
LAGEVGDKMSIILKISPESGFLHVGATGNFSLVEAKRTFTEMLEAVAQNKIGKVLFDGRGLAGNPRIMERFYYGEFAAQAVGKFAARGVFPTTQFAYVLEVPILDPGRFGETVAVNRGMYVKTFDNPDDALGWLGIAPANNLDAGDGK